MEEINNDHGIISFREDEFDTNHFRVKTVKIINLDVKEDGRGSAYENAKSLLSLASQKMEKAKFIQCKLDTSKVFVSQALEEEGFRVVSVDVTFSRTLAGFSVADSKYDVKSCEKGDVEALYDMSKTMYSRSRFHNDLNISNELADEMQAIWIRNCYDEKLADEILILKNEGRTCGYCACKITGSLGEIILIGVAKEFQGKGIASALMQGSLKWFQEQGCESVSVETQLFNEPAVKLYQKHGFSLSSSLYSYHKWI